jgi:mono/diheme cytochrome c family protein
VRAVRFLALLILTLALPFCLVSAGEGGVGEGKNIFEAGKCGNCHQTKGPPREKIIQDVLKKKGPELWYAGSKFKEGFLFKWLQNPEPIRPMAYYSLTEKNPADHPGLSAGDAREITTYLMSLRSEAVNEGAVKPKKTPRGRVVFARKQSCFGCHL